MTSDNEYMQLNRVLVSAPDLLPAIQSTLIQCVYDIYM